MIGSRSDEDAVLCLPVARSPDPVWETHADVPRSPTGKIPEGPEGVTEAVSPTGLGRVGVTQPCGCCAEQRSRDAELLLRV